MQKKHFNNSKINTSLLQSKILATFRCFGVLILHIKIHFSAMNNCNHSNRNNIWKYYFQIHCPQKSFLLPLKLPQLAAALGDSTETKIRVAEYSAILFQYLLFFKVVLVRFQTFFLSQIERESSVNRTHGNRT